MPDTPTPPMPPGGNFARFMGVGFQMLATIGLCTWLGVWLDGRYGSEPWGTVGLTLFGVFVAMYLVIREVSEK
ncbi:MULTISPECIES: AtpZ/AtpI family protein [Hymenobacter]|uniref:AtpZ/AtpI family protein n=2 Tax=Hymenobacter TaxID=89966 RepID=A0ABY7PP45_9BACT|nr:MULTISPECIES: AtpZ/AtpI family protein [Hymenobacter]WBA41466.1 AtpZ/AtpI family protein [Hymenobacter canadensis]WBO84429.1 AtpZ/AtpI family protein [Hymenobacter yonginensis]